MSLLSRFRRRLPRFTGMRPTANPPGPLREFIYLDEVSVYSILASRRGSIATEFTESQTASLNNDISGSVAGGFGLASAEIGAKVQSGEVRGSQVLRKATIQTSFKELYDIERGELAMGPPRCVCIPTVNTLTGLEAMLDSLTLDGLVLDSRKIRRGDLLEVEVELEADPIFHMVTVISAFRELIEDKDDLFGHATTRQLAETHSIAQVLEILLAGLVPIRGRLIDYEWARIADREVILHRELLSNMSEERQIESWPVFVVGVAQRDLFWKDIRRVLFSEARYTVYCRLAKSCVSDKWHPVTMADMFSGIAPSFGEQVGRLSEIAKNALTGVAREQSAVAGRGYGSGEQMVRDYVTLLVDHHCGSIKADFIDALIRDLELPSGWMNSVDGRRRVFREVTRRIDETLEVETPSKIAHDLRSAALSNMTLGQMLSTTASGEGDRSAAPTLPGERYLDTEIIAIYW